MLERPTIVYLDEPITIHGIEIKHTEAGLRYLVEHIAHCVSISTDKQMDLAAREHARGRVDQYKQHIQLYERQREEKNAGTGATKV